MWLPKLFTHKLTNHYFLGRNYHLTIPKDVELLDSLDGDGFVAVKRRDIILGEVHNRSPGLCYKEIQYKGKKKLLEVRDYEAEKYELKATKFCESGGEASQIFKHLQQAVDYILHEERL